MNLETLDQLHPDPMARDYHPTYSKQNKFQLTRPNICGIGPNNAEFIVVRYEVLRIIYRIWAKKSLYLHSNKNTTGLSSLKMKGF